MTVAAEGKVDDTFSFSSASLMGRVVRGMGATGWAWGSETLSAMTNGRCRRLIKGGRVWMAEGGWRASCLVAALLNRRRR